MSLLKKLSFILFVLFLGFNANAQKKSEFDILTQYMVDNNLDLDKVMDRKTWIPTADAVVENLSDYFIIDLRQGDDAPKNGTLDFEDGHLPGAHNVAYKEVIRYAKANNAPDRILVVSEDGQAAAAAAVALRMAGFPKTKVLKFGMSGWNTKFNVWSKELSGFANKHNNWTKDIAPKPTVFESKPVLKTGKKTGKEIAEARAQAFLDKGYEAISISPKEMMDNADKLYVVNQGTAKEYDGLGMVKGAQQFACPYIKVDEKHGNINNYPSDKTIVQYCLTGHAALTTASWLNILGYDAKGMEFGINGLIFDTMSKSKFSKPANYEYVTGK